MIDDRGCAVPPPDTFTQLGLTLDLAKTEWGEFIFGGIKVEQSPEVRTLISQAAADDRLREYLRCRAVNDERNTPAFRQYTAILSAFLQTKPTAREFTEWVERNPAPTSPTGQTDTDRDGTTVTQGSIGRDAFVNTGPGSILIGHGKKPAPDALVQAKARATRQATALFEVDRGQRIAPRIDDLQDRLRIALDLYDNEQYERAATAFDEIQLKCDELSSLIERRAATSTRLQGARRSLDELKAAGAPKVFEVEFLGLVKVLSEAEAAYENGSFADASERLDRFLEESPRLIERSASTVKLQRSRKQAEQLGAPSTAVPQKADIDARSLDEAAAKQAEVSLPLAKSRAFGCGLLAADMHFACVDRRLAANRVTMDTLGGDDFSTDFRREMDGLSGSRSQRDFQITTAQYTHTLRFLEGRGSFTKQIALLGQENEFLRDLPRLEPAQTPDEDAVWKGVITRTRESLERDWGAAVASTFMAGVRIREVLWSMESTDRYGIVKYGMGFNYNPEYIRKRCDALVEHARSAGFPEEALGDVETIRAAAKTNQIYFKEPLDKLLALRKRMQEPF